MSKMETDVIAFYQCHGAKYTQIAVKLGLVVHGHNRGDERSRYKHTLAHCRQAEEIAVIEVQFGALELVSCRRASNTIS